MSLGKFVQQVFPEHLLCATYSVLGSGKIFMVIKTEQASSLMELLF